MNATDGGDVAKSESGQVRAAIVGARGIGRHHANWWMLEGAEVCAIAGSTPESAEEARANLASQLGFAGKAYSDIETLLAEETPDVVDVCSPNRCHYGHVRTALEAGCDVLCEKPFVYQEDLPHTTLREQAEELLDLAAAKGRWLSVCTQFALAAPYFAQWWRGAEGPEAVLTSFQGELHTPARGRGPDPRRIWVDLAPHPISVLYQLTGGGSVRPGTMQRTFDGFKASATFEWQTPEGHTVHTVIDTRNTGGAPQHLRRMTLNDTAFTVDGFRDASGVYGARVYTDEGAHDLPDFMRLLVRGYVQGNPPKPRAHILGELDLLLEVLDVSGA